MKLLGFFVGVATGIISGCGIGGGSLLVLYLTTVMGVAQQTAGSINLLYFVACAPAALIGHIRQRLVVWRVAILCAIAGIVTVIPTSLLSANIENNELRRLFGLLLLYIGIREWRLSTKKKIS